jgi:alpha-ribazole phosphatase
MRHPPVAAKGICYGQSEVPLLEDPHPRLVELDRSPVLQGLQRVWSSPWTRALVVAEWIAASRKIDLQIDGRVSELSFGAWEGRRFEDLEREFPQTFYHWMDNWQTAAAPGGESVPQLIARVRSWVLERKGEDECQLLVAHAGVVRALRMLQYSIAIDSAMQQPVGFLEPEKVDLSRIG